MSKKPSQSDIQYGDTDLSHEDWDYDKARYRLFFWVQGDLYRQLEAQAKRLGMEFEAYAEYLLRKSFFEQDAHNRLNKIEERLNIKKPLPKMKPKRLPKKVA